MIRLLETGTLSSTPPSICFAFITDQKRSRNIWQRASIPLIQSCLSGCDSELCQQTKILFNLLSTTYSPTPSTWSLLQGSHGCFPWDVAPTPLIRPPSGGQGASVLYIILTAFQISSLEEKELSLGGRNVVMIFVVFQCHTTGMRGLQEWECPKRVLKPGYLLHVHVCSICMT